MNREYATQSLLSTLPLSALSQFLKPCPFCGSIAEVVKRVDSSGTLKMYTVRCCDMGCYMASGAMKYNNIQLLIEDWNRRAPDQSST